QKFRRLQTLYGKEALDFSEAKDGLRRRLEQLRDQLDRYLADEYDVAPDNERAYERWHESHRPFHWFAEFYGTMSRGGFDVIIGNPPYVELKALSGYRLRGYACLAAGNLYAVVMERCMAISPANGRLGFIVPVSSVSTDRYASLQRLLLRRKLHY